MRDYTKKGEEGFEREKEERTKEQKHIQYSHKTILCGYLLKTLTEKVSESWCGKTNQRYYIT